MFCGFKSYNTCSNSVFRHSSSSHMCVINHNWSAMKQRLHPQSVAEISRHSAFSFVRGQDSTMWDIVCVSSQGHRSVSVSRHFLLQAPQCPCSVRKRFSRDCRAGGSMLESTGSHGRGVERRVPEMRRMVEFNCTLTWLVWIERDQTGEQYSAAE